MSLVSVTAVRVLLLIHSIRVAVALSVPEKLRLSRKVDLKVGHMTHEEAHCDCVRSVVSEVRHQNVSLRWSSVVIARL